MKEIISKELLSDVLGVGIRSFEVSPTVKCVYYVADNVSISSGSIVNIYELAHKCKEKARKYGFSITTGNRVDGTDKYDVLCIHKNEDIECGEAIFFNEIVDTEPNSCFLAMQWILDNKDKR